jgi:serine/threonine protein kinase
MSPDPGTRLGSYEITAAIRAGGMGEVYRARDLKLRRDVAIKILPTRLTGDPERLGRFLREARTSAAINHPNIATVYEVYEVNEATSLTFVSLKLCIGHTTRKPGFDRVRQIRRI